MTSIFFYVQSASILFVRRDLRQIMSASRALPSCMGESAECLPSIGLLINQVFILVVFIASRCRAFLVFKFSEGEFVFGLGMAHNFVSVSFKMGILPCLCGSICDIFCTIFGYLPQPPPSKLSISSGTIIIFHSKTYIII